MYGYKGIILRIDLTNKVISKEALNKEWLIKYLGGKGLAIKYLYEELEAHIDPLSEKNKLIVMTGPFTGTAVPCSGKIAIASKSPATGTILDCSIGGSFGAKLKYAGYDGIILEGRSEKPVYIDIKDHEVEIRDADHLWGRGAHEVELELKNQESEVLTIGQAGENLVKMACINTDLYRQAGRGGIGAVMGSKHVKAIRVEGSACVKVAYPDIFLERVSKLIQKNLQDDHNGWAFSDGTSGNVEICNASGCMPTENFTKGSFEYADQIGPDEMRRNRVSKKGCFSCILGCGNFTKKAGKIVEGPEYETLSVAGANCGIRNLESIIEFNRLCDDFGVDTISVGNITAFAMEMTEKGVYDFGLRFGDDASYLKVPELISKRIGIGKELSKGVKYLGEKLGQSHVAMEVKGLEFPGYDPRGAFGMALTYATADRGACHLRSYVVLEELLGDADAVSIENKSSMVADLQKLNGAKFSLIFCDFLPVNAEEMAEIYEAVVGVSSTEKEIIEIGTRVNTLARLFNVREGFSKKDDVLPRRVFDEILKSNIGDLSLKESEFDLMLEEFYGLCDWDDNGIPRQSLLESLDL
ncbi:aldehyde ferredoxin oxidoreductase [Acidaminobacter sp. JC074]|uniref:aldehyde ferredoxin oxidoreductase family protein n=1 Tax=Acidaminobacter sp. JC074 TaxID=2530199 RepID=UPI001F0CFDD7|nr:aldehyde ferredoxin oxidoreductase family protein [Acidaminobacter sp. JC074]MCH4890168.1 aldehyde ferredoxin oxidoreductase [Acidaminobacter sp. JC074]